MWRALDRAARCGAVSCLGALALLLACQATTPETAPAPKPSRYTFSWPLEAEGGRVPRGGTTTGQATTDDPGPSPGWQSLQEEGLSDFERDRRAILAMTGPYRVSFDFLETYSLTPDYTELDVPYQSWATEYVYLVEDRGDFISLQHIMVMYFVMEGETVGPLVTKHWRQDWTYQDRDLHVYAGNGRWERREPGEQESRGAWSQAVFQVDDSPRYEALGRWRHDGNLSVWESETTWRPLPRREFSARDDYQVLVGTNRHVITPEGWIHEQENAKRVLTDGEGSPDAPSYLAKEIGLNRYVRIREHDFSAGDAYWEQTGPYWQEVRAAWREIYQEHDAFVVAGRHEGAPLFARHFAAAEAYAEDPPEADEVAGEVREVLADYVSPVD